ADRRRQHRCRPQTDPAFDRSVLGRPRAGRRRRRATWRLEPPALSRNWLTNLQPATAMLASGDAPLPSGPTRLAGLLLVGGGVAGGPPCRSPRPATARTRICRCARTFGFWAASSATRCAS